MAHSIERCTPILVKKKYFPTLRILFTCGVTLILRAKGGGMLPHSEIHTCLKVYYSEEVKMGVVLLRREISELREIRKIGEPSFPCGVTLEKRERKKCMVGAPYHHLSLSDWQWPTGPTSLSRTSFLYGEKPKSSGLGLSLNGSQFGGCSTEYNTLAATKVVCRRTG